jgi:NAD(P)-dependent dehydrogenase (short-subunit alcohol dehydrogenase family)
MNNSSFQHPIHSGFGAASTATEVIQGIDLAGKIAIVTGGYSGIGRETVKAFLSAGARVIVPARDLSRASQALANVPGAEIEEMDLLSRDSIDAFADRFLASGNPLHLLVNNAGIMATPLTRDARGNELQFATNHLGHFQLTQRLWPALVQARGARVVSVSSRGHRFATVDFDDPNFLHRPYDPWLAYGQSKTANVLFAVELDARGKDQGIRAFSLHPGGILETGLAKHQPIPREELIRMGAIDEQGNAIINPEGGLKTPAQGAATQVWCATSPLLEGMGGVYCDDVEIAELIPGDETVAMSVESVGKSMQGVMSYAVNKANAERLWEISEKLIS